MSKSPLVTIGSHDMNHVPLPNSSYDEQERELVDSKKMIEELIGLPVKYLAYPYGQHNKDTLRILNSKKLYSRAFVAGGLCYNWIMAKRIYKLPRLFVADSTYERCISNIQKYTT